MNIYEKMSCITTEITAVAKNLNVGWGKSSYKAVGEADVLAAVKPIEAKHGVYSYPLSRSIIESGVLTSVKNDGSESRQQFLRIETIYRFVNTENPEEYIDITTYGDGVDSQDKAPGKAMTYGDKYALLKAYKIITGDDPDQFKSEPLADKTAEPNPVISAEPIGEVRARALAKKLSDEGIKVETVLSLYNVKSLPELTESKHRNIIDHIKDIKERQESA